MKLHALRIAPELSSRHATEIGALAAQTGRINRLRREGVWVSNGVPQANRRVYVVLLHSEVGDIPGVQRANPQRDPNRPCVYVGETALSEDDRLRKHLAGDRASRWVKQYGERTAPEFNSRAGEMMTRLEALRWERDLTRKLRHDGFTVLGGH